MTMRLIARVLAVAGLALSAAEASDFSFPLVDQTGLDSSKYTIYAMGFSYSNNLVMNAQGQFVTQTSGTVKSYPVGSGSGQIATITLDSGTVFVGGRFYFFIVKNGQAAPTVSFGSQPTNPPDSSYPPYTIVEMTNPAPNANATLDVQTVDGFTVPLTVTLDNQTNVAGKQYGQPVYDTGQNAVVNRAAIFTAYTQFMQGEGSAGTPYQNLVFSPGSIDGQAGGILNPGAYLTTVDASNQFLNLGSSLNTAFDADLSTLFGTATLKLQGVASATGDSGSPIATDYYNVTSTGSQTYPGTSVSLPALQLTGVNSGNVFTVFNPVGIAVLTNDAGGSIVGTISGNTLTIQAGMSVSSLSNGMYVSGAGLSPSAGLSTTQITSIAGNVLTLNQSLGSPAPNSQYRFSKLPQLVMFQTPGQMVFANSGVFADSTVQYAANSAQATVLGNLENQLVSALNRGVALNAGALSPGGNGGTSAVWGDQRNWYPASATQNLFSLFMHAGTVSGSQIFFQPSGASSWPNARGQAMGSAYGFAYDENGGPVPPAPSGQPEVPSKFDQNVPSGSTIRITFTPWDADATEKPKVKITTKKKVKISSKSTKVKGTVVGSPLYVKYTKKPGKVLTKKIQIKSNGKWVFKFTPAVKNTELKFYSYNPVGTKSSIQKVKVIKKND